MRGVGERRIKQWETETLGDLWNGEGWGGEHGEYKMDGIEQSVGVYSKGGKKEE